LPKDSSASADHSIRVPLDLAVVWPILVPAGRTHRLARRARVTRQGRISRAAVDG
jgi:hypothetical protein